MSTTIIPWIRSRVAGHPFSCIKSGPFKLIIEYHVPAISVFNWHRTGCFNVRVCISYSRSRGRKHREHHHDGGYQHRHPLEQHFFYRPSLKERDSSAPPCCTTHYCSKHEV